MAPKTSKKKSKKITKTKLPSLVLIPEEQIQTFKFLHTMVMADVEALAGRGADQSKMCRLARDMKPLLEELEMLRNLHKGK